MESDCSVPEELVEVVAQASANKSMLMVYAHAHASQLNLYLLPQVQLPIKIF